MVRRSERKSYSVETCAAKVIETRNSKYCAYCDFGQLTAVVRSRKIQNLESVCSIPQEKLIF